MRSICQEYQNVPAAIPVAPTSARAAHIARSTAPHRPTDCAAALLCAAMTPGGGLRASASCNSIHCACAACHMARSRRLRWSTTSFRIAETKSCSGMSTTGRRCARLAMTGKPGADYDCEQQSKRLQLCCFSCIISTGGVCNGENIECVCAC